MTVYQDMLEMQAAGFTDDEVEKYRQEQLNLLSAAGFSVEEIASEFGKPSQSSTPKPATTAELPSDDLLQDPSEFMESEFGLPVSSTREMEAYWRDVFKETKQWAVGEKAEWGEYWERGLGKSTINLALQYHSKGEIGYDASKALSPEPEDTGHIERWFETMTNIGADMPVFIPSAVAGSTATGGNVFAGAFTAGFVNESIKSMYIDALSRGETSNWNDWWNSFVDHGFKEGMKSGLTLGVGVAAPGWLGVSSLTGKYATQYAAFTGVGAALEQKMPTSDELINTALVLGTFGGFEGGAKAKRMFTERMKKTDKSTVEVVQQVELNPRMQEDLASKNIERFRDPIEPTEAIQPFKEGSNPKRETPDVLYEVRPEDVLNIRNETINTERYNELRESGLEPDAAAVSARTEKIDRGKFEELDAAIDAAQKAKDDLAAARKERDVAAKEIDRRLESGDLTPEQARNLEASLEEFVRYNEARQARNDADRNVNSVLQDIEARQRVEAVETVAPVDRVLENVEFEVPKPREAMSDVRALFTTQFIDRLHPVLRAVRNFEEQGGKFETTMTPYEQMRLQPGMIGRGMHFLQHGTLDFKTLEINGKSLMKVLEPLKTEREIKDFTAYAVAKRALEKTEQGFETGFDIAASRQTVAELGAKYEPIFRELVEFQDRGVQYLFESGVISAELRSAMLEMNRDYVPFNRVMDDRVSMKSDNFSQAVRNPMKKFKGSQRKVQDPLTTIHLNTLSHIAIAERNFAYTKFIEMVEALPEAFPEIRKVSKARGTKITPEELNAVFDGVLKPEYADGMTVFRRNGQVVSKSEIAVFRNGKREVWEVGNDIAQALTDMNRYQSNMLLKFLGTPSRLLRAGATLAPDFMARNLARDALSAAIFSDRGFVPFYHNAMGFWHMVNKTELYKDWTKSGAMQSMLVSFDRNYFRQDMQKYLTSGNVRNVITNPMEALRAASELFESSGRIGQYSLAVNQLKKQKKLTDRDIMERAGFESRDITIDFSKMGTQMQALNMISAFFNARVQGYAKIYEAFQKRPAQTSAKIFAYITLPSMLLWYKNHDDPRYKQLRRWEKDLFWIVITGDGTVNEPDDYTVWRIPKPFELGLLFGTGAERMMDFVEDKDPGHLGKFFGEFAKDSVLSMGPIPDFAKPSIEFWANKNFFTDRPIVSRGMENMLPEFQYDQYTSATAKTLGKLINEITFGYGLSSPQKIDHLIGSWTGTLGRYAVEAADKALIYSGLVVQPTKPEKTLEDLPVIRAFLVRKPTGSSQYIEDFYRKYEKIGGRMATIEKLQKEGRMAEARGVLSDTDLNLIPLLGFRDTLSNINKTIRLVYAGPMSAKEKRQMIDQLYLTMIEVAKAGLETVESLPE